MIEQNIGTKKNRDFIYEIQLNRIFFLLQYLVSKKHLTFKVQMFFAVLLLFYTC